MNMSRGVLLPGAPNYELGFQTNEFEGDKNPVMTMSKYDYKSDKSLDHYLCDAKVAYID